jgi:predicted TIM-barrel fold metal-dependent hydrolase
VSVEKFLFMLIPYSGCGYFYPSTQSFSYKHFLIDQEEESREMGAPTERRRFLRSFLSFMAFGFASVFNFKKSPDNKTGNMMPSFVKKSGAVEAKSPANLLKIDAFTHVAPKKYVDSLQKIFPNTVINQPLWDLDQRFRMMDQLGEIRQILTLVTPPIDAVQDPANAADLASIANDGIAEIVLKYPDRFPAGAAALPMNNMEAALKELERSIKELGLKGVQIFTSINGKPLDSPEFMPLYEKMAQYDLPIWVHPLSHENHPFYPKDLGSGNDFDNTIGWPHATSMAMMRLAACGILERFPGLKFITHHSGGTVPYLAKRIEFAPSRSDSLARPVIESLRMFYYDTAVQGNTPNLMCANAFCGADHQLFGTDFPMADASMVKRVIGSIDEMGITDMERQKIYSDNIRGILSLTL